MYVYVENALHRVSVHLWINLKKFSSNFNLNSVEEKVQCADPPTGSDIFII